MSEATKALNGAAMIAAERERQKQEERWTPEHDDGHHDNEMVAAARCYINAVLADNHWRPGRRSPVDWPWGAEWYKPSRDPIRNLVKAGALIAAEIDRLQRAAIYERDSAALSPSPEATRHE